MRHVSIIVVCALLTGLLGWTSLQSADKKPETDPWVGTYLKFGGYDAKNRDGFAEELKITITKQGEVYKLSKPYDQWEFKETEKGVLTNPPLGTLYLATAEFPKKNPARVLRVEFCYEHFILYRTLPLSDKNLSLKEAEPRTK